MSVFPGLNSIFLYVCLYPVAHSYHYHFISCNYMSKSAGIIVSICLLFIYLYNTWKTCSAFIVIDPRTASWQFGYIYILLYYLLTDDENKVQRFK
jgi:hypothetical protein